MHRAQRDMKALYVKGRCDPWSGLAYTAFQIPFLLTGFLAMNKAPEVFPSMSEGGALWFVDLTSVDPTYGLPALFALAFCGNMEGTEPLSLSLSLSVCLRLTPPVLREHGSGDTARHGADRGHEGQHGHRKECTPRRLLCHHPLHINLPRRNVLYVDSDKW